MSHRRPARLDGEQKGHDSHEGDEVFCFHGDHEREDEQFPVWIGQAVGQQDAVDGAAGAHHGDGGVQPEEHRDQPGAGTGEEIVAEEGRAAPLTLQHRAKHPQDEHVHGHVPEAGVQEHVGEGLPEHEARPDQLGHESQQGEQILIEQRKGNLGRTADEIQQVEGEPDSRIDEDQPLDDAGPGTTPARRVEASGTGVLVAHGWPRGCGG